MARSSAERARRRSAGAGQRARRAAPGSGRVTFPAAAAALLLVAGACAPRAAGPLLLHPVPPAAEGYRLERGAVVYETPELAVSARPRDWRLVEAELREAGEPSPFGDAEGAAGSFVFIEVRFENRGARTLVYNAMRSSLVRPGEPPVRPLETSDLFAFAGEDGLVEARARAFARRCYDGTVTLRGGEAVERLLAFRAPAGAEGVELVLDEVYQGTAATVLRFPFEAFPGD